MNPAHEPASPGDATPGQGIPPQNGKNPQNGSSPHNGYAPPSDGYEAGGYEAGGYEAGGYGPMIGDQPPLVEDGYGWPDGLLDDRPPPRPWGRSLRVGALTALALAVAGAPLGLLWAWLSPDVPVGRSQQGDIIVTDPSPEQFVAADGWFTLLGLAFGVLAAIAVWMIVRRHRGPILLLGVVLGALGAAGVAWQLGRRLGLGEYQRWQDVAAVGATFHRPPDLHAHGPLLVPAFGAVIVTTLLAGWASDPDLSVPGARPGYQPTAYDALSDSARADRADPGEVSLGSPVVPDPTTAPAPPGPGTAGPPHG